MCHLHLSDVLFKKRFCCTYRCEQQFWSICLLCKVVHKLFSSLVQFLFDLCCNWKSSIFQYIGSNAMPKTWIWNTDCDLTFIVMSWTQTWFCKTYSSYTGGKILPYERKLTIWAIVIWLIDCYISWEDPEDFATKLLVDWQDFCQICEV